MSFIPGRFLNPGVAQQVNARQDILGNRERLMQDGANPETFSFFSKKVPFVRLTSAIDISNTVDEDGNYINHTSTAASTYILDNGVKSAKGGEIPGYEKTSDLGFRPKPGITDMQLNTHNRFGSLRTATVSFEVHSVEQLDQYEELFMRPGYSALLEWGNSYYLDNETKKVHEVSEILSDRFLTQEGLPTKLSIYTAIDELRTKYSYNYDAMYGLLKNFRWTIRPDGGYSCTVDLVSVGTVIESLTVNTGITDQEIKDFRRKKQEVLLEEGGYDNREEASGSAANRFDQVLVEFEDNEQELYENKIKPLFIDKFDTYESVYTWSEDRALTAFDIQFQATLGNPVVVNVDVESQIFIITTAAKEQTVKRNPRTRKSETSPPPSYTEFEIYKHLQRSAKWDTVKAEGLVVANFKSAELKKFTQAGSGRTGRSKYYAYYELTYALDSLTEPQAATLDYDIPTKPVPQGPTVNGTPSAEAQTIATQEDENLERLFRNFNPETDSKLHLILSELQLGILEEGTKKQYEELNISGIYTAKQVKTSYSTALSRYRATPDNNDTEGSTSDNPDPSKNTAEGIHYIQLGAFLDILNRVIPAAKVSSSESEKLFTLHTSKDLVHRHKTLENLHASIDPVKFILPQSQELGTELTPRGDILNIFVGIAYLEDLVRQKLQDGELRIYELITTLLEELNIALGKINSFELQYFENTFKFHIIDRELIDPNTFTVSDIVDLELIGKNSTLLSLNLTSKLSPAIGSQLAIAAQADPVSNGIEGTGWAKFNKGLKDRYIPEKDVDLKALAAAKEDKELELQEKLARVFLFLDATYYRREIGAAGINIPSIATEYGILCKILLNDEVKGGKDFGTIIPYELNLELEGMSGFEVMRSFIINEQIIPKVYRNEEEGIAFLITGLTHKVSAERWTVGVKAQIYNTNTKGLASVKGKLNLKGNKRKENTEVPSNGDQTPEWPYYSDSDAVPEFIWDPSTGTGPSNNRNVSLNTYIETEYIPALEKVTGYSKGLKLLATVMTRKEGFYPNTRSYRTNNPGNVGNTDVGKNQNFDTLQNGIEVQLSYLKRVANGTHSAYPVGKDKDIKPYYSPEIAKNQKTYGITPYLPGYKFTPYTGTLEQFVKIYATGARAGNSYLSTIISYFKQNGFDINEKTTIAEIDKLA